MEISFPIDCVFFATPGTFQDLARTPIDEVIPGAPESPEYFERGASIQSGSLLFPSWRSPESIFLLFCKAIPSPSIRALEVCPNARSLCRPILKDSHAGRKKATAYRLPGRYISFRHTRQWSYCRILHFLKGASNLVKPNLGVIPEFWAKYLGKWVIVIYQN